MSIETRNVVIEEHHFKCDASGCTETGGYWQGDAEFDVFPDEWETDGGEYDYCPRHAHLAFEGNDGDE